MRLLKVILTGMLVLGSQSCQQTPTGVQTFDRDHIPQRLSDWGLFVQAALRNEQQLQLNDRVQVYDLSTPLFTDYAQKLRTVWLPPGQTAQYQADDIITFPVGTIISKTFYYPLDTANGPNDGHRVLLSEGSLFGFDGKGLMLNQVRLLETRILIHQSDGWQAIPYVWNREQTEAFLAPGGDWIELSAYDPQQDQTNMAFDYLVPDTNQCAGCHASNHSTGEPVPIGPKARYLNTVFSYSQGAMNQLDYWQAQGLLTDVPEQHQRPQAVVWNTQTHNIEQRARAYLDINCAHCHNTQGPADTSGLFLDWFNEDPRSLGLCKPPVAAGKGSGGHQYAIVPGAAHESILHYRMLSTDPGQMMPELGRSLVHEQGLALIAHWINQLPGQCNGTRANSLSYRTKG